MLQCTGCSTRYGTTDLYDSIGSERFALIVADPPAVPMPRDLSFPLYGSGGTHGDRLLRRIVRQCRKHLEVGGHLLAVTELHAASSRPPMFDWLQRWAAQNPDCKVRLEVHSMRLVPPKFFRGLGESLHYLPGAAPGADGQGTGARLEGFARERQLYLRSLGPHQDREDGGAARPIRGDVETGAREP